jgi:hypothetical protein
VVSPVSRFIDELMELVTLVGPWDVSDLACKDGLDVTDLFESNADLALCFGLDPNLQALRVARRVLPLPQFYAIDRDVHQLPLKVDMFDTSLCVEVPEHLKGQKQY